MRLLGDEFNHHYETVDGYTIVCDDTHRWVYALPSGDNLIPSSTIAHNPGARNDAELRLVSSLPHHAVDMTSQQVGRFLRTHRDTGLQHSPAIDYNRFRGLIILINYDDCAFRRDDAHDFYNHMVDDENYTGYQDAGSWVECPGSVRDYYRVSQTSGTQTNNIYIDNITFSSLVPLIRQAGDINGDGKVDIADVNAIINMMLSKTDSMPSADINGDGKVDITDVNMAINIMLG